MDVTFADRPGYGATIVTLSGQLDVDSAPDLQAALAGLMQRRVVRIVVDLGPLKFCDSTGLSAFVVVHRSCTAAGGFLRLAAPAPLLLQTLAVVGLLAELPVYASVTDACLGEGGRLLAPPPQWVDR